MPRKIWTPQEDAYLRQCVGKVSWKEAAQKLNRSYSSVTGRVCNLGLKHPKAFIAQLTKSKWESGEYTPEKNHCFMPGNIPANKGLKQTDFMSQEAIEATKATRFKQGHLPHNHKPVGSERVDTEGYVYVKVEEPNKWELKHRLVWQQHVGPILPGTNIQFKDGNRQNCNIENLYAITRQQQIDNNTIHRYPAEVKSLIRLKNKFSRHLKNYAQK
jgi:hypothetical protein